MCGPGRALLRACVGVAKGEWPMLKYVGVITACTAVAKDVGTVTDMSILVAYRGMYDGICKRVKDGMGRLEVLYIHCSNI